MQKKNVFSDDLFDDSNEDADLKPEKARPKPSKVYLDEDWIIDEEDAKAKAKAKNFKRPSFNSTDPNSKQKEYPAFGIIYKMKNEFKENRDLVVMTNHRYHTRDFSRYVFTDTFTSPLKNYLTTVLIFVGLDDTKKEEELTREEIATFMEGDPLYKSGHVEKFEIVNLKLLGKGIPKTKEIPTDFSRMDLKVQYILMKRVINEMKILKKNPFLLPSKSFARLTHGAYDIKQHVKNLRKLVDAGKIKVPPQAMTKDGKLKLYRCNIDKHKKIKTQKDGEDKLVTKSSSAGAMQRKLKVSPNMAVGESSVWKNPEFLNKSAATKSKPKFSSSVGVGKVKPRPASATEGKLTPKAKPRPSSMKETDNLQPKLKPKPKSPPAE